MNYIAFVLKLLFIGVYAMTLQTTQATTSSMQEMPHFGNHINVVTPLFCSQQQALNVQVQHLGNFRTHLTNSLGALLVYRHMVMPKFIVGGYFGSTYVRVNNKIARPFLNNGKTFDWGVEFLALRWQARFNSYTYYTETNTLDGNPFTQHYEAKISILPFDTFKFNGGIYGIKQLLTDNVQNNAFFGVNYRWNSLDVSVDYILGSNTQPNYCKINFGFTTKTRVQMTSQLAMHPALTGAIERNAIFQAMASREVVTATDAQQFEIKVGDKDNESRASTPLSEPDNTKTPSNAGSSTSKNNSSPVEIGSPRSTVGSENNQDTAPSPVEIGSSSPTFLRRDSSYGDPQTPRDEKEQPFVSKSKIPTRTTRQQNTSFVGTQRPVLGRSAKSDMKKRWTEESSNMDRSKTLHSSSIPTPKSSRNSFS